MMTIGMRQIDTLNNAMAELRAMAQSQGIETLLIVATQHRLGGPPHGFVSVGSIDGCNCCAMESLGRLIGMGMSELMIADLLNAIQSAYGDRASQANCVQATSEVREMVLS
jgi:hypothetical protein